MRHKVAFRKFSRTAGHRRAMLRNLATSLIMSERYETTVAKAKDLRGVVERLITSARSGTLSARRQALGYLMSKDAVTKLFEEIAPRYAGRPGGYTRVLRTRFRPGDAAEMAVIELVAGDTKASAPAKSAKKSGKKSAAKGEGSSAKAAKKSAE
jgi:large subunit ribosomal protein L17